MVRNFKIKAPFFEIGPKAYLYGKEALDLAKEADRIGAKYDVGIIYTPQYVDIPQIAKETQHILVFAQHMDSLNVGRGIGSVLPEALVEAGACGVLLNHAEKSLPLNEINKTIKRADEVGLATIVCADTPEEAAAIAHLSPNIIIAESPDFIGGGKRGEEEKIALEKTNKMVGSINPNIKVLHAAGISCGKDVFETIAMGAQACGSTSGIIKAENPFEMLEEMIKAVREAWDKRHKN